MSTWPILLPQAPEPQGYTNVEKDNVIRSSEGYGPDKVRQRTTFAIRQVTMKFFLEKADVAILDNFYVVTLGRTATFTWIDHRNDNAATYRFTAPPNPVPYGTALWWDVSLELEILG